MFDIDDYYLGFILPTLDYFNNPKSQRYVGDVSFDPFQGLSVPQAFITGKVVLLRKKDDSYIDEEYSMYENELKYKYNETNNLGINLCFVRPFTDYYDEDVNTYIYEDVENDYGLQEDMVMHSYYVVHSKLSKKDALIINDEERLNDVRLDFFKSLMDDNTKQLIKTNKK